MTTSARDRDWTVFRLHCPHHHEDALIDFFLAPGERPYFWWLLNRRELGDYGWEGLLWEGGNLPSHLRPSNVKVQRVAGPSLVGRPGPWNDSWLMQQPADIDWDEQRGIGHRAQPGIHYDPEARGPHVRYEIRCLRPGCSYNATMTRPNLFDVFEWVLENRGTLPKQVELLQKSGQGQTWSVARPARIVTAPPNPTGYPRHDISYWAGHEPVLFSLEWHGLQRLLATAPK